MLTGGEELTSLYILYVLFFGECHTQNSSVSLVSPMRTAERASFQPTLRFLEAVLVSVMGAERGQSAAATNVQSESMQLRT